MQRKKLTVLAGFEVYFGDKLRAMQSTRDTMDWLDSGFYEPSLIWSLPGQQIPYWVWDCPGTISRVCLCHQNTSSDSVVQKLLILHWQWFLGGCSDIVTSNFAYKDCQYDDSACMQLHSLWIVQDAKPKMVDAPLMLIFKRWLQYHGWPLYQYRRLILWLWLNAVAQPSCNLRCKSRNLWRSVDA